MKFLSISPKSLHPASFPFAIASTILLAASILRHQMFESNALDLGWFDQSLYLIAQGQEPIVSIRGWHVLGDHAAFILYPLALLYRIYPSVYWLLIVQAIALAASVFPLWKLAKQAGLEDDYAQAMLWVYLLYPLIFNVNLFDFHPEVLALPAFFWAIWAARAKKTGQFAIALIIILASKAVLSLTVAAMGIWLIVAEKRRSLGLGAFIAGSLWFYLATQVIIPQFSGAEAAAVNRYTFLGNSVAEIALNLALKPQILLSRLLTGVNLEYLLFLVLPVLWGLFPRYLLPLIAAAPALFLNLLTDYRPQKDLVHQYSLPILPFLLVAVITALAEHRSGLHRPRWIILWSLVTFVAFAKVGYFGSNYLQQRDTWSAMREAIAQVPPQVPLLTSPQIAPHLSQRPNWQLAIAGEEPFKLEDFQTILLNTRHPGWADSQQTVTTLVEQLQRSPQFQLQYERDGVVLFQKINTSLTEP